MKLFLFWSVFWGGGCYRFVFNDGRCEHWLIAKPCVKMIIVVLKYIISAISLLVSVSSNTNGNKN